MIRMVSHCRNGPASLAYCMWLWLPSPCFWLVVVATPSLLPASFVFFPCLLQVVVAPLPSLLACGRAPPPLRHHEQ